MGVSPAATSLRLLPCEEGGQAALPAAAALRCTSSPAVRAEVGRIEASGGRPVEVVLPDCSSVLIDCDPDASVSAVKDDALRMLRQRQRRAAVCELDVEAAGVTELRRALRHAQAVLQETP
jgi:hypothetical protein